MSCYATLSSHVQKAEFPDNGPSDFKARLPKDRLWQEDDGWEVGLPGASFPAIPPPPPQKVHAENILVDKDYDSIGHPDEWDKNRYLCTYDIVRDYPFIDGGRVSKEGHRQDGTEDRRESVSWGYTVHRCHGEFEDDEEKNGRDSPLGRGRSGVGQYACVH